MQVRSGQTVANQWMYSWNTSSTVLRHHLEMHHAGTYLEGAKELGMPILIKSLVPLAHELDDNTRRGRYTPHGFIDRIVRFVIANDEVRRSLFYLGIITNSTYSLSTSCRLPSSANCCYISSPTYETATYLGSRSCATSSSRSSTVGWGKFAKSSP